MMTPDDDGRAEIFARRGQGEAGTMKTGEDTPPPVLSHPDADSACSAESAWSWQIREAVMTAHAGKPDDAAWTEDERQVLWHSLTEIGRELVRKADAVKWAMGYAVHCVCRVWGEGSVRQFAIECGCAPSTAYERWAVYRAFPDLSARAEKVLPSGEPAAYRLYARAATRTDEPEKWLAKAVAAGWTTRQLDAAIDAAGGKVSNPLLERERMREYLKRRVLSYDDLKDVLRLLWTIARERGLRVESAWSDARREL
jgi:hypothetical protein